MENAHALKKRRCWVCVAGIRSGIRQTPRGFSTRPSFRLTKLIQIVRNGEDERERGGQEVARNSSQVASLPSFLPFFFSSPSSSCPIGLLPISPPSSASCSFQKAIAYILSRDEMFSIIIFGKYLKLFIVKIHSRM